MLVHVCMCVGSALHGVSTGLDGRYLIISGNKMFFILGCYMLDALCPSALVREVLVSLSFRCLGLDSAIVMFWKFHDLVLNCRYHDNLVKYCCQFINGISSFCVGFMEALLGVLFSVVSY